MNEPVRVYSLAGFDPAENLAREEALLADLLPGEQAVIFYTNRKSVICGKNQNPWLEADLEFLEGVGAQLYRRKSGGGAVWHDEGNLNYSFLSWRSRFDADRNHQLIITALAKFGIRSEKTARGDLLSGGRKFSGNAYWYLKDRVLHHGTLLIDADLERLAVSLQGLAAQGLAGISRANRVESKPSRTVNLRELSSGLKAAQIIEEAARLLGTQVIEVPGGQAPGLRSHVDLPLLADNYRTWEWNFGRTHSFELQIELAGWRGAQDTAAGSVLLLEVTDGLMQRSRISRSDGLESIFEPENLQRFDGARSIRQIQEAAALRPGRAPEGWSLVEGEFA